MQSGTLIQDTAAPNDVAHRLWFYTEMVKAPVDKCACVLQVDVADITEWFSAYFELAMTYSPTFARMGVVSRVALSNASDAEVFTAWMASWAVGAFSCQPISVDDMVRIFVLECERIVDRRGKPVLAILDEMRYLVAFSRSAVTPEQKAATVQLTSSVLTNLVSTVAKQMDRVRYLGRNIVTAGMPFDAIVSTLRELVPFRVFEAAMAASATNWSVSDMSDMAEETANAYPFAITQPWVLILRILGACVPVAFVRNEMGRLPSGDDDPDSFWPLQRAVITSNTVRPDALLWLRIADANIVYMALVCAAVDVLEGR